MLGGYAIVASGLPIPLGVDHGPRSAVAEKRLAGKDRSRPFPCMDKPCGCATAEQCFSNCCCNTPAETLAWARAHGSDPAVIVALQRRLAARPEPTAAASSCRPAKKEAGGRSTPGEPACCAEAETGAGSITLDGCEICGDFASLAATANEQLVNETTASPETDFPGVEPVSSRTVVLKAMLACGGMVSQWLSVGGVPPRPVVTAVLSFAPLVEAILPGDSVFSCVRFAPDAPPPRVA